MAMKNFDTKLWVRRIVLCGYDVCAVIMASLLALIIRFDFDYTSVPVEYLTVVWDTLGFTIVMTLFIFSFLDYIAVCGLMQELQNYYI